MATDDTWWAKLQRRAAEVREWFDETAKSVTGAKGVGDLFQRVEGRLSSLYNMAFANKNVVIFGPKGGGKTSLIAYLKTGKAVVAAHDPTAGLALVDRKFEIDKAEWLNVSKDPGGDHQFRHLWPRLVRAVDPDAAVFVLDGRKDVPAVEADMRECLSDALSGYGTEQRRLKLIYVFVNFYDAWQTDPRKKDLLGPRVQMVAAEEKFTYPALAGIKLAAHPTHLNPAAPAWPEMDTALEHFATDLGKLT